MLSINWRTVPFFRLVIPFMLGIWCSVKTNESLPFPIVLLLLLVVLAFGLIRVEIMAYRKWWLGLFMSAVVFLLGWQITFWNNPTNSNEHLQYILEQKKGNSKYWAVGKIINIPTTKNTTKIELQLEKVGRHPDSLSGVVNSTLLCYVEADSLSLKLEYGQSLVFQSFINPIEPPKNPHQFDYKQFLGYNKIYHQAYLSTDSWQVLENSSNGWLTWINQIRTERITQIKTFVKGEAEQGVAMALLLGFKDELSQDLAAAYSETGAIHVLAVSGLHVGIIAMILRFLLKGFRLQKQRYLKLSLMILPLWFYAFLTGFTPSVIRATVMFTLIIIGLEMKHQPNIYNVLAASAFMILFFEPYFLFSVGFQLSYAAVIGIVYFQPKIAIWYLPMNKIIDYFWQMITVSFAATLGTLPFTLFYFHQFPIWFWLSSAIVIPAAFVILSLGLIFFTFGLVPGLDKLLGTLLHWTIRSMNWCIQTIQDFPISVIKGLWFTDAEFYVIMAVVLTFGFLLETRKIRWTMYSLGFIIILAVISLYHHWQSAQQKQVVIYSLSNTSAIDFINGQTVTTFQSDNLSAKNYEFAAQSHHWQMNVKTVDTIAFAENLDKPFLKKQANLIQFYDKTFLIINNKIKPTATKIEVDYLILINNPKTKIADLTNAFTFKKVIFDGSNKYWQIKNWKEECEALNIDYQDVRNDFAFVLDF